MNDFLYDCKVNIIFFICAISPRKIAILNRIYYLCSEVAHHGQQQDISTEALCLFLCSENVRNFHLSARERQSVFRAVGVDCTHLSPFCTIGNSHDRRNTKCGIKQPTLFCFSSPLNSSSAWEEVTEGRRRGIRGRVCDQKKGASLTKMGQKTYKLCQMQLNAIKSFHYKHRQG